MSKRKPKKVKIRARSGALLCVTLLLVGSGVLRLSDGAGMAIAREFVSGDKTPEDGATCTTDDESAMILAALDERTRKLDEREDALDSRFATLSEAEAEIERNMSALVEAEQKLAGTMALAESAAEDDLGKLTAVYESMKPKDAAALFSEMQPEFAAGFLGRMRPDSAAQVMTGLSPDVAYSISVVMAGRNASAPTK